MLVTIIFILLGGVVLIAALVLFSPIEARISFRFNTPQTSATVLFSFFHPSIIAVLVQMPSNRLSIRIFGRVFGRQRQEGAPAEPFRKDDGGSLPEIVTDSSPVEAYSLPTEVREPPPVAKTDIPEQQEEVISPQRLYDHDPKRKITEYHQDTPPVHQEPAEEHGENEKIAKSGSEKDNWFEKIKNSQVLFFIRQHRWYKKIIRALIKMVRSLFTLVRIDRLTLDIKAGISDPMLLGTLSGVCLAAQHALIPGRKHSVRFEPLFAKTTFSGSGSIRCGTSIGTLIKPLVVLLISLPYAHTVLVWFRYRRYLKSRRAMAESV